MKMNAEEVVLEVKEAVARLADIRLRHPFSLTIHQGEQWAIIGPNGAGKNLIANILLGKTVLREGQICNKCNKPIREVVKCISFKDIYSLTDCRNTYYQQRWHSTEIEDLPTVSAILHDSFGNIDQWYPLADRFGITDFLSKKIITLSSGELRKFLIVKTLISAPRLLILDNPYIGLDCESRKFLTLFLQQLAAENKIQIILLLADPKDIPPMITHVLPVKNRCCYPVMTYEEFTKDTTIRQQLFPGILPTDYIQPLLSLLHENFQASTHKVTFKMEQVSIKYGTRTILSNLNWEVHNGEKWMLSGPNGSGKSTLLSLIYADNPQAYSNTIYLFDRKRGTGESIWEIKKRIGYISPEMHLYFMDNTSVSKIVESGFFDTIGGYGKCSMQQKEKAQIWMRAFGLEPLKDRPFLSLSSGEQRLVLLTRSFVKDPDLLILDEPLHGLDADKKIVAVTIIQHFSKRPGKTLIYVTHYPDELPDCLTHHFYLHKQE